jgi:hypothetical protein
MKKTNKVNPLEFFRKSAEARQKAFKTGGFNVPRQTLKFGGLRKKDCGGDTGIPCPEGTSVDAAGKPLGANIGIGNFNAGYSGNVGSTDITNNKVNAGYNGNGLGVTGAYDFANKSGSAGASYNKNGFAATGTYDSKNGLSGGVAYDKNGFKVDAGYGAQGANAGISYTGNVGGKNGKIPIKVGLTYNKKGGIIKSKMKTGETHTMPNGKVMLNSAMKKKTSKKK